MPNFALAFCKMSERYNNVSNRKEECDATATGNMAQYKLDMQNWYQEKYLNHDVYNKTPSKDKSQKYSGDAARMNGALGYVQSVVDEENTNTQNDPQNQTQMFSLGQSVLGIANDVDAALRAY